MYVSVDIYILGGIGFVLTFKQIMKIEMLGYIILYIFYRVILLFLFNNGYNKCIIYLHILKGNYCLPI